MLQEIYAASNLFLRVTGEMIEQLEPKEAAGILGRIQSLEKATLSAYKRKNLKQLQALSLQIYELGESVKDLLRLEKLDIFRPRR